MAEQNNPVEAEKRSGCLTVILTGMGIIFTLLVFGWIFGEPSNSNKVEKNLGYDVKPEQIVTFKPGSFACLDKEKYKTAIEYAVKNQETKFRGLFQDFECVSLKEDTEFKVLSVDGGYWGSYVEITTTDSNLSSGGWIDGSRISNISH